MHIAMIAAMANNRVIGKDNQMPWHLPEDLKHFKETTLGKPIVMGRKTFESIGRPLPGRRNIVITRQQDYQVAGIETVGSFDAAKALVGEVEELVVIGGGELYRQLLTVATRLYLTKIELEVEGDTFFPDWIDDNWQTVESSSGTSSLGLKYHFVTLTRK